MSYWINAKFTFDVEDSSKTFPKLFEYKGIDIEWNQEDLKKYFACYFKGVPHREYSASIDYNRKSLVFNISIRCGQSTENSLATYIDLIEDIGVALCQDVPFNFRMSDRMLDFNLNLNGAYALGGGFAFQMNLSSDIRVNKDKTFYFSLDGYGKVNNRLMKWKAFNKKYYNETNIHDLYINRNKKSNKEG